ncbi:MAG TPA: hypothetical protein VJ437_06935 [Acidiferrobacterales bacterium]|nr:hypothetical protein [Acidiferrobacterales bacterium]
MIRLKHPICPGPAALIRWVPVIHNLNELDEEIVQDSVRFRWRGWKPRHDRASVNLKRASSRFSDP